VNVTAQDIAVQVIILGDVSYLDNIIKQEDLKNLNQHDLRILKNTIFAKYGYEFASEDLKDHFSNFSWYNGNKPNVQNELTETDWINIALIQSLEKSGNTDFQHIGSFGKKLNISEKIIVYNRNSDDIEGIKIEGEIIAYANKMEIARAEIINNGFCLDLNEVPLNILEPWDKDVTQWMGVMQCSDHDTKIANITFELLGTLTDLDGKKRSLEQYLFSAEKEAWDENLYYKFMEFSYIYTDRDTTIRQVADDHDGMGREIKYVQNVSLKKGWNKVKYHRKNIGKYDVYLKESSFEDGKFRVFLFKMQTATLHGKIINEKNSNYDYDDYYIILDEPFLMRIDDEPTEVSRFVLWIDSIIHKTLPHEGEYTLFGDISRSDISPEGYVWFYVVEMEEK
jgi:hypothetical protein